VTTAPSRSEQGVVQAWIGHVDSLTADFARLTRARAWLDPEATTRYARYRHDEDRHMFLLGRVMARALVGRALGVAPTAWGWRTGPRGRPEIDRESAIHFNLAHSAGLVACVVARDREVGVDVEDRHRRALDPRVVDRYCSPAEAEDIRGQQDRWLDRFLTYWTLKEAYLKARGLGIAVPVSEIEMTLDGDNTRVRFLGALAGTDPQWAFHLSTPTPRHLVALAAPRSESPVTFQIAGMPDDWLP
jgi:4'-phosphopantetheinyl transferase